MSAVAFVGLGAMGSRLAGRLLDAGHELTVWNRTPAKAEPLRTRGARVAATPAEAAGGAELVLTMLTDPDALADVTEGPNGVLEGVASGATLVEMSTVGPAAIARLAATVPPSVDLADAPVLGSLAEAESGSLTIFVGASDDVFARCAPLLAALGSPTHVGPVGAGAAAKLVANSTLFGVIGVLGEAIALADGLGLPRETTFEVLAASPLAAQAERRRRQIEAGDYPPRFALSLARKDAELVLAAAEEAGVDLRLARAAASWLADAQADGDDNRDYAAVLARILQAP